VVDTTTHPTQRVQLKGVPDNFFKWCRDTGRDPGVNGTYAYAWSPKAQGHSHKECTSLSRGHASMVRVLPARMDAHIQESWRVGQAHGLGMRRALGSNPGHNKVIDRDGMPYGQRGESVEEPRRNRWVPEVPRLQDCVPISLTTCTMSWKPGTMVLRMHSRDKQCSGCKIRRASRPTLASLGVSCMLIGICS
jgi:hypothetical protein